MANHEKIFGICENKCQHEVYGKTAADEQFLSKSAASNLYATKNHSSSKTDYGIGNKSVYGHVKLTNALNVAPAATSGIGLCASAGKELNDKIVSLQNDVDNTITDLLNQIKNLKERVTVLEHKVGS